jgi:hypothetical protein
MKKTKGPITTKVDNSDYFAKKSIRQWAYAQFTYPAKVLEVLPGEKKVMNRVWKNLGASIETLPLCKDVLKILPDTIDFDIADIDTYSSPFEIIDAVLARAVRKRIVIVTTDGCRISMEIRGGISKVLFPTVKKQEIPYYEYIKAFVKWASSRENWTLGKRVFRVKKRRLQVFYWGLEFMKKSN